MTAHVTHEEAMRVARRTGELLRNLHGEPALVVGIARSGTGLAEQVAIGARPRASVVISVARPSSSGAGGTAREWWKAFAPRPVRRLYKTIAFRTAARVSGKVSTKRMIDDDSIASLRSHLAASENGLVIVVDDVVDSGHTAQAAVDAIASLAPAAPVMMFAIGSTLGRKVGQAQLTLSAGAIVDFVEGDLAELHDSSNAWTRRSDANTEPQLFATSTPPPKPVPTSTSRSDRRLFLDLDGTLTSDSFLDAMLQLQVVLRSSQHWEQLGRFLALRLAKKSRFVGHRRMQIELHQAIESLDPDDFDAFTVGLAERLKNHSRLALAAIAQLPQVECIIVTAALDSYRPAIELAFGLPVITGSGPGADGSWIEVNSDLKLAALGVALGDGDQSALLIGDTVVDSLAATSRIDAVAIPTWDTTGLATVLALSSWWLEE